MSSASAVQFEPGQSDLDGAILANQKKRSAALLAHYDYIVCGTGSSGSVVAGRLAADSTVSVLVLEAGGSDAVNAVMNPNAWVGAFGTDLHWDFRAEPNPRLNGRAIPYQMGKVLGGGSSINVCIWSRGHRADWDYFAAQADSAEWNHAAALRRYAQIEDWHGESDPNFRSGKGPIHLRPPENPHPFFSAIIDAAASRSFTRFENPNGAMMAGEGGCSFVDEIVHEKSRQSVFRSYLYPRMSQQNVTVLTGALVTRVVFSGHRAVGVEFRHGEKTVRANAGREIVLALGAIQTPKVLMQSGIGDRNHLARFDIALLQHLPGVGRNLHDHIALGHVWESAAGSMPTVPRSQAVCFWKSRSELDAPNLYLYARAGASITPENAGQIELPQGGAWSMALGMRPASRGSIELTGPSPDDRLKIDAGFLSNPDDLKDILSGVRMCREVGTALALEPFTKREIAPGNLDEAGLEQFVRNGLLTFWHQCGTAKMGRDGMSVVDSKLKVYGVESLRIADASIMPRVTTGNTMAPCVVIGEQAAAFIQAAL
jgi:choline dehydrogenase